MEAVCSSERIPTSSSEDGGSRCSSKRIPTLHLKMEAVGVPPKEYQHLHLKMEAVCPSETLVSTYKSTRRYSPEDQYLHLKMEAVCSSETLVSTYKSTWRYSPEDHHDNFHCRKNIKSHKVKIKFFSLSIKDCPQRPKGWKFVQ
jgi:hypothetical protein